MTIPEFTWILTKADIDKPLFTRKFIQTLAQDKTEKHLAALVENSQNVIVRSHPVMLNLLRIMGSNASSSSVCGTAVHVELVNFASIKEISCEHPLSEVRAYEEVSIDYAEAYRNMIQRVLLDTPDIDNKMEKLALAFERFEKARRSQKELFLLRFDDHFFENIQQSV